MRRRTFLRGAAALAAAALARPVLAQPREVKLAAVLPLSGPAGPWGQRTWNGIRLACDLVNEDGGLGALAGAHLACMAEDTESKAEMAGWHAKRLISRGAVAVVGCSQSAASVIVSEIAQRSGVSFITPTDLEPSLTARGFTFTFRTAPTLDAYAHDLLAYVREIGQRTGTPPRRLAIVSERSVVGEAAAEGARRAAAALGYEVVDTTIYDPGSAMTFDADLARSRRAGAEVVVGHSGTEDAIRLTRALAGAGFEPKAYGGILGGQGSAAYARALGRLAEDVLGTTGWWPDIDIPGLSALGRRYHERFREALDGPGAAGINAVAVLWDALERARSGDRAALREAIAATDLQPGERRLLQLRGVKFLPSGENERAGGLVVVVRDGAPLPVAPRPYAKTTAPYPKPPWARASAR